MTDRSRDAAESRIEPDWNRQQPQLTDEQWLLIAELFPVPMPEGG